jgi:hypothetical protein
MKSFEELKTSLKLRRKSLAEQNRGLFVVVDKKEKGP